MAGIMDGLGKAVSKLANLGEKAVDGAKDLYEKAKPAVEETFDKVTDGAKDLIDKIEYYIVHLKEYNFQHLKGFECSAAFGLIGLKDKTGGSLFSVEEELQLADLAMYEAKHTKTLLRYIPYEEAVGIVEDGSLEEKLAAAAKKCSR